MRTILSAVTLAAVMVLVMFAGPAYAFHSNTYNTYNTTNETTNNRGGNAHADADASARSSATAKVKVDNSNTNRNSNTNKQGQLQGQGQEQGQSQVGINQQTGVVKNIGPQVVITETYETSASSAIAPNVNTSQLQVDCPLFVQDGVSLGGSIVQGAGSFGVTNSEIVKPCLAWLAAGKMTGEPQALAVISAYCLSFEAISVKNALCVDWRRKVEMGGAYAPATIEAGAYVGNEGNDDRS